MSQDAWTPLKGYEAGYEINSKKEIRTKRKVVYNSKGEGIILDPKLIHVYNTTSHPKDYVRLVNENGTYSLEYVEDLYNKTFNLEY